MTKEQYIQELISTPEGVELLAAHMVQPTRCGGQGYDADGTPYLIGGGWAHYADGTKRPLRADERRSA